MVPFLFWDPRHSASWTPFCFAIWSLEEGKNPHSAIKKMSRNFLFDDTQTILLFNDRGF